VCIQHKEFGTANRGADVEDLYIMDTVNSTHYKCNGTVQQFELKKETIKVKGGNDRHITVRKSVFGPVITDNGVVENINTPLSLKWISILPDVKDTTVKAFIEINFARTFEEFRNALSFFVAPSQNFVFADNNGNIGYQMSGRVPIRSPGHTGAWPVAGDGMLSYPPWVLFM
jgi:penicillin amidase